MTDKLDAERVFRSIVYEFDDDSIYEIQRQNSSKLPLDFPKSDGSESMVAILHDHVHKGESIIFRLTMSYVGSKEVLSKERVVDFSTIHLLGWLADVGSDITFSRVEINSANLADTENMVHEDVTIEARALETQYNTGLSLLRSIRPSDF